MKARPFNRRDIRTIDQSGFTLIEVLVAMAFFLVSVAGIDRFRVTRAAIDAGDGVILIDPAVGGPDSTCSTNSISPGRQVFSYLASSGP